MLLREVSIEVIVTGKVEVVETAGEVVVAEAAAAAAAAVVVEEEDGDPEVEVEVGDPLVEEVGEEEEAGDPWVEVEVVEEEVGNQLEVVVDGVGVDVEHQSIKSVISIKQGKYNRYNVMFCVYC